MIFLKGRLKKLKIDISTDNPNTSQLFLPDKIVNLIYNAKTVFLIALLYSIEKKVGKVTLTLWTFILISSNEISAFIFAY